MHNTKFNSPMASLLAAVAAERPAFSAIESLLRQVYPQPLVLVSVRGAGRSSEPAVLFRVPGLELSACAG